jgi:hypothetical protein
MDFRFDPELSAWPYDMLYHCNLYLILIIVLEQIPFVPFATSRALRRLTLRRLTLRRLTLRRLTLCQVIQACSRRAAAVARVPCARACPAYTPSLSFF